AASPPPVAERDAPRRVIVYDLAGEETDAAARARLTEALLLHLGERPGFTVLGESEVKVMLAHAQDQDAVGACGDDRDCLARIEAAIDADRVISGRVGHLGASWVVTLELADPRRAVVERVEAADAESLGELEKRVGEAADRLLGVADAAPPFALPLAPGGVQAAVVDLVPHGGVAPGVAQSLTQLLSLELRRFDGLRVISRDEIATMLRYEADKHALDCADDTECLARLGGALGVDYLVGGSVGKLGDSFVVTLKLMDVEEAAVAHRASESLRGTEADLAGALRVATWSLLGRPVAGTGEIEVKANVPEGELVVGDAAPRPYPRETVLREVRAGKLGVTMRADGYVPLYQETYVFDGKRTLLRLDLAEEPAAWYEQWWPWAIVGGVVVAGVVTAVVLSQDATPAPGHVDVTVGAP
ncbi:MAG: hypothetical protein KC635_26555, partial [Myxococcales bacterium]|nr:hypothetical protein [Myxococcales bacterium]